MTHIHMALNEAAKDKDQCIRELRTALSEKGAVMATFRQITENQVVMICRHYSSFSNF